MENLKYKKKQFIPGLGEKAKDYNTLASFVDVLDVDWSTLKAPIKKADVLIGFSRGCDVIAAHSITHKVKTLIFCSLPSGAETLAGLKTDKIIFLVGSKETWLQTDLKRLVKTATCPYTIIVIKGADHSLTGIYEKTLKKVMSELE